MAASQKDCDAITGTFSIPKCLCDEYTSCSREDPSWKPGDWLPIECKTGFIAGKGGSLELIEIVEVMVRETPADSGLNKFRGFFREVIPK